MLGGRKSTLPSSARGFAESLSRPVCLRLIVSPGKRWKGSTSWQTVDAPGALGPLGSSVPSPGGLGCAAAMKRLMSSAVGPWIFSGLQLRLLRGTLLAECSHFQPCGGVRMRALPDVGAFANPNTASHCSSVCPPLALNICTIF